MPELSEKSDDPLKMVTVFLVFGCLFLVAHVQGIEPKAGRKKVSQITQGEGC